jgi:hypothetical protein
MDHTTHITDQQLNKTLLSLFFITLFLLFWGIYILQTISSAFAVTLAILMIIISGSTLLAAMMLLVGAVVVKLLEQERGNL